MANPRKFSEKIALLNQKEAQETAAFEAIMREVSDVTSRVASASSSVGASPTGSGAPETPLSVRSADASPPQSSGKHLHINLGNQFKGGSLPNVNNNANNNNDPKDQQSPHTAGAGVHSIDLKTALTSLEEMQHNSMGYRGPERSRNIGVGPMRSRPMEKRHDTSPYSGAYLSPPPPDTWRRTNSDSALHQSANEACQSAAGMQHRRGSDAYQHNLTGSGNDNRDSHHGFIERPRSSCEMPRVPGINIYPSSQPPGQQIPIGNNTGSLPDLSNVHFPSPLHTPLDQEEHSSSTPFSNNHLSVPVNSRFLRTRKSAAALENSTTSTSQQDLQSYTQQPPDRQSSPASIGRYVYQSPHSPVASQNTKPSRSHRSTQQSQSQQVNSLGSYRTSQQVNRPSPQSSPSLTVQGSPLSYSNNTSAPSSPTGRGNLPGTDNLDQNNYYLSQAQAAALQQDFEQITMMDSPVAQNAMGNYMGSPNHPGNYSQVGFVESSSETNDLRGSKKQMYFQSDVISIGSELGSGDAGYFSTSPQMAYQSGTTSVASNNQQLTPQTPNTPTIILTDFSGADDLTNPEFVKDLGTAMMGDFDPDLFPSDDALREGLDPVDVVGLQMLTDPTMVISDPNAEAHFRLDRL